MKKSVLNFIHSFRYYFLCCMRISQQLFWCLAFPVLLSALFFFAFSNLSKSEAFRAIPVAVVVDDNIQELHADTADAFRKVTDSLSTGSDTALLSVSYENASAAKDLLQQNDIAGILTLQEDGSVLLSISGKGDTLQQSILKTFTDEYNLQEAAILQTAVTAPAKLPAVLNTAALKTDYIRTVNHTGNMDESLTYFYNLIAMFCLYASMSGFAAVINCQANLSDVGMRNALTPVPRSIVLSGSLTASFCIQYACILVTLAFNILVLRVDFGSQLPLILISCAAGCLAGVCLGFAVGSIGRMSEQVKSAVLMVTIMSCSGLSGLYAGNARIYIEHAIPVLNRINPAALISDCFYSMVVCSSTDRLMADLRNLLIVSAVLFIAGIILERGKQYESL